jgi:hypothetical protein
MNTDYSLLCYNSVLVHIDMDVSEERASPFRFEGSGSELMVEVSNYFSFVLEPFLQL